MKISMPFAMTEKQFQSKVVELAELLGWKVYHTYDSRRSAKGFPDLVMVRRDTLLFLELKVGSNKVTPFQHNWLSALSQVKRIRVKEIYPADAMLLKALLVGDDVLD